MLGAISTKFNKAYVEIAAKTNKQSVIDFMKNYLAYHRNSILIMDNHKSHKSKELKTICNSFNVKIVFLPPISSSLNPVERLWSVVKYRWGNYLL